MIVASATLGWIGPPGAMGTQADSLPPPSSLCGAYLKKQFISETFLILA